MVEVREQCKGCFHFQVCAEVMKQQLFIREKVCREENPRCDHYSPAADVVEVDAVSEQIIRKKAEVNDYWQNDVKQYRATRGYSDIEKDADNFLRGYNEAVGDMLAILEGEQRNKTE